MFWFWGTLVLKIYVSRNLSLYIHSFVFNTDIDVKLLYKRALQVMGRDIRLPGEGRLPY
jgi:hypothetical protein